MSHIGVVSRAIGAAAFCRRLATALRFSELVYLGLDVPTLEDAQVAGSPLLKGTSSKQVGSARLAQPLDGESAASSRHCLTSVQYA